MEIFGIGLDQSVMNQPTQINLSDWANLCLFRLAIARRRISTVKIYIDKTGSAEALYKIEAFLSYCYEVCHLQKKIFFCFLLMFFVLVS